ncbi:MAG TPA: DNA cytosine methyltransferase [Polyangia bacterium]|nr:DNA cytosine methyltransferase [Polyangia bacterium]
MVFENVRGLLTARGPDRVPGSALNFVRRRLLDLGWQTRVDLLNAADFGVPQRRVRIILVGFRTGDPPGAPRRTHAEGGRAGMAPWITLSECLVRVGALDASEVIRPSGKMADELAILPAGTGAKSPGKRESTRPGGHWGYKQGAFIADLALPARTVTASAQQDWIRDPNLGLRRLCPRECAAIQSFPASWGFEGRRSDQYRLIGNAVSPRLATHLGLALRQDIDRPLPARQERWSDLQPLPARLQSAIRYTVREELRNGESRRAGAERGLGTRSTA